MEYNNVKNAVFLFRKNRFIAEITVDGIPQLCHVKNTGRCKELLIPGARIFVQDFGPDTARKTRYDLISVYKENFGRTGKTQLINIDSQAPNKIFREWLDTGTWQNPLTYIKPEYTYGNSRFDFYMESGNTKILAEVKGVTLEEGQIAYFPDAPTERGLRHIRELCKSVQEGYQAMAVFIVQMQDILSVSPNMQTHPAFGFALKKAQQQGVQLLALDCEVTETGITAGKSIPVIL